MLLRMAEEEGRVAVVKNNSNDEQTPNKTKGNPQPYQLNSAQTITAQRLHQKNSHDLNNKNNKNTHQKTPIYQRTPVSNPSYTAHQILLSDSANRHNFPIIYKQKSGDGPGEGHVNVMLHLGPGPIYQMGHKNN